MEKSESIEMALDIRGIRRSPAEDLFEDELRGQGPNRAPGAKQKLLCPSAGLAA
jgi:hypothetical protein